MKTPADVKSLTRFITKEIYSAFGMSSDTWLRFILNPIFHLPAGRFSQVAARFDQDVAQYGFREAVRRLLPWFASSYRAVGVENIPREGPLLLASNHPGTCDSLVITASIPRDDLKIIITGIPFVQGLPCAAEHLIYVPREGPGRANVIRQAIRHLKDDGALLIFPSGTIDPDPALAPHPESTFERWSPSVEMMLRYAPQARVLLSMVSGVLSSSWLRHPLTRLGDEAVKQRRIAEFMQIIQQMVFPHSLDIHPTVTFGEPLQVNELTGDGTPILDGIIQQARQLLDDHIQGFTNPDTVQA
jgi:1-acyl-sn-glycerol-3-phosphate acyltransferase